jgi:hypothetical protein
MLGVLGFMVWTFASMSLAGADGIKATTDAPVRAAHEKTGYAIA